MAHHSGSDVIRVPPRFSSSKIGDGFATIERADKVGGVAEFVEFGARLGNLWTEDQFRRGNPRCTWKSWWRNRSQGRPPGREAANDRLVRRGHQRPSFPQPRSGDMSLLRSLKNDRKWPIRRATHSLVLEGGQNACKTSTMARSSLRPCHVSYFTSARPLSQTPKEPTKFHRAQPQPASLYSPSMSRSQARATW